MIIFRPYYPNKEQNTHTYLIMTDLLSCQSFDISFLRISNFKYCFFFFFYYGSSTSSSKYSMNQKRKKSLKLSNSLEVSWVNYTMRRKWSNWSRSIFYFRF